MSDVNGLGLILTSSQESTLMYHLGDLINENEFENFSELEIHEEKYNTQLLQEPQLPVLLSQQQIHQDQPLATEEYAGDHNFQMLPDLKHESRTWTYSSKLKKVFTEMGSTLPICVKWTPACGGLWIRAVMAFCLPNHRSDFVIRCPNHTASSNQASPHLHHVLSCKQNNAIYSVVNGHHIVRVPLETPQPGMDYVQMDFAFHCKNSCSPGINRRATEVVFHLETEMGVVLGRRKVPVKICSCPKRDRKKDEEADREYPAAKKRKLAPGKKCKPVYREPSEQESNIFTFNTRIYGKENYEILKKVAHGLMATAALRDSQSPVIGAIVDEIERMP